MQAINHVATALLLKKAFPKAPLLTLILGSEAVEILWVGLNIAGIERTVIDSPMRSVADIHLIHMPYSHSIVSSLLLAVLVGLLLFWRNGKAMCQVSAAIMLAIISHIVLDLLVHAPDIKPWPLDGVSGLGSGLYEYAPMLALCIETLWGVFCWWVYRGSWALLLIIISFALVAIPSYSPTLNIGEGALGGQSLQFAVFVFLQILIASVLIWLFRRKRSLKEA